MDNEKNNLPVSTSSTYWLSEAEKTMLSEKAISGDVDAAFRLAQFYSFVDLDCDKERYWLEHSARAGHPVAQYNLSFLLFHGETPDLDAALYWAKLAEKNGEKKAQLLINEIQAASK